MMPGTGATSFEKTLAGIALTVILALGAWGLSSLSSAQERLSVIETENDHFDKQLDRLESKVDEILHRVLEIPRSRQRQEGTSAP